ncbi:hypothetical protein Cgig2_003587 [Carnegiea gigantea]|uniref:Uncharacterized protein n=1 Tax=Carnegiea gigantea TaxID=171969 RepID=A0A9Q1GNN3_9CARY|nr:hypothetical protein Cgig2_003587 [Carnegiea gigantea]
MPYVKRIKSISIIRLPLFVFWGVKREATDCSSFSLIGLSSSFSSKPLKTGLFPEAETCTQNYHSLYYKIKERKITSNDGGTKRKQAVTSYSTQFPFHQLPMLTSTSNMMQFEVQQVKIAKQIVSDVHKMEAPCMVPTLSPDMEGPLWECLI